MFRVRRGTNFLTQRLFVVGLSPLAPMTMAEVQQLQCQRLRFHVVVVFNVGVNMVNFYFSAVVQFVHFVMFHHLNVRQRVTVTRKQVHLTLTRMFHRRSFRRIARNVIVSKIVQRLDFGTHQVLQIVDILQFFAAQAVDQFSVVGPILPCRMAIL
jgi:hypothetical protein